MPPHIFNEENKILFIVTSQLLVIPNFSGGGGGKKSKHMKIGEGETVMEDE